MWEIIFRFHHYKRFVFKVSNPCCLGYIYIPSVSLCATFMSLSAFTSLPGSFTKISERKQDKLPAVYKAFVNRQKPLEKNTELWIWFHSTSYLQLSVKKILILHIFIKGDWPCLRCHQQNIQEQLNKLEALFKIERYTGILMCEDLAQELNVGEDRIQVRWLIFSRNITLSLNEKFTTQKSSTLVLAHLPLTW